jgi:hypothetical protein
LVIVSGHISCDGYTTRCSCGAEWGNYPMYPADIFNFIEVIKDDKPGTFEYRIRLEKQNLSGVF